MLRNPLPLREILICEALDAENQRLLYLIVLRKGLEFELLGMVRGDHCALMTDETTLLLLEGRFGLPVRVFSDANGAFLGMKTLFARREGSSYSLKGLKVQDAP